MNNTVKLQGWPKGVIGKYSNHLNWPQDALSDGSNVELSNGGLQSRRGFLYHSDDTHPASPLPSGTVRVLQQVRFPSHGSTFLVAQVTTATTDKLYYCSDELGIAGAGDWVELYDLGTGAGPVTVAVLNDRAIFTEGVNHPPLVWGGSITDDGSDWQTPKNVLLSWDEDNFHDGTAALTDPDSTTSEGIGGMGAGETPLGSIYVCLDQAKCTGLYLEMGTGTTDCSPVFSYWDGTAWETISVTADGTGGLAETGIVTWDEITIENTLVGDLPGFYVKISPQSQVDSGATISEIRFQGPCQPLQNIGDGQPDIAGGVVWHDSSTGAIHDISADLSDYTEGTYKLINDGNPDPSAADPFDTGDYWYIGGYPLKFNAVEIGVHGDWPNESAASLYVEYWNGSSWISVGSIADGTDESGVTLNHKGKISWDIPTDWRMNRPLSHQYPLGYWVRLSLGGGAF